MRLYSFAISLCLCAACTTDEAAETARPVGPTPPSCAAGELLVDAACVPLGVHPDSCGAGFESDQLGGCVAILPAEPCPSGQMAIPGETSCRPVMDCPDGPWGDIPVEPNTEFVDGAYLGGSSDGSQDRPWTTVGEAVAAAESGAIVAIAEGSYPADLWIESKQVRLWGRCPQLVELVGSGSSMGTVVFTTGADGSQVQQLALTGARAISMSGAVDVLVRRVWIHDTGDRGMEAEDPVGPTSVDVEESLIEGTREAGLFYGGAQGNVIASMIRNTEPVAGPFASGAVGVAYNPGTQRSGDVRIRSTVIEQSGGAGISVSGGVADIEGSVVRDIFPGADLNGGAGIVAGASGAVGSQLDVRQTVIERSHEGGIVAIGSHTNLDHVSVRDVIARASDGHDGRCLQVQDEGDLRPTVNLRTSLLERCVGGGVMAVSADVWIEGSVVRGVTARPADNGFGDGVAVAADPAIANLNVAHSLIQDTARAGVANFGGNMTMSFARLRCNAIPLVSQDYLDNPATFQDGGENSCGCNSEPEICRAVSAEIQVPTAD